MSAVKREPLYLCGTTASGKTTLALAVAEAFDGEVVNADAFQVYRGLEVLSAAPTEEEKSRCPHHLFGTVEPADSMDAARHAALAEPIIADIQEREKLPIIVGGSGLYLKFLTHGVADAPTGDPELRAELNELSVEEIRARLERLDPEEAAHQVRQNANNHRHLSRALEICLLTGGKASERRKNFANPALIENLNGIVLSWPREVIAERIALRTANMMRDGAVEEVASFPPDAGNIRQAIGVKQIEAHLHGETSLAECEELITIATRQYAKRQRNWFRRESWLQPIDGALPVAKQLEMLSRALSSGA